MKNVISTVVMFVAVAVLVSNTASAQQPPVLQSDSTTLYIGTKAAGGKCALGFLVTQLPPSSYEATSLLTAVASRQTAPLSMWDMGNLSDQITFMGTRQMFADLVAGKVRAYTVPRTSDRDDTNIHPTQLETVRTAGLSTVILKLSPQAAAYHEKVRGDYPLETRIEFNDYGQPLRILRKFRVFQTTYYTLPWNRMKNYAHPISDDTLNIECRF